MFLEPVSSEEILNIIYSMKSSSAPGEDGIKAKDLKILADLICAPLADLINRHIQTGCFPDHCKSAILVPIFKSGDKSCAKNYRPIALLKVLGKVFEKVIADRIYEFIVSTKGFDKNQFGFQKRSSTELAVIEVLNIILGGLDNKKYVAAVFIDLQKAFDTVNHDLLLKFLSDLGVRGIVNDLLRSYLTSRTVMTRVGNTYSAAEQYDIGVPQGSILGPLLYILFINNIQNAELQATYKIYADDTVLLYTGDNKMDLELTINNDLKKYRMWVDGNKLTLNAEKTKLMIFRTKNKQDIDPDIYIGNSKLERINNIRYLGILIDDKLSWDIHVDKIISKVIPIIGVISRCGFHNRKTSNIIYKANILPYIRYGLMAWYNTSKFNINRVHRLLNKTIKILYGLPFDTPSHEVYNLTNNLEINEIIFVEKVKLMHKIILDKVKCNIKRRRKNDVHSYLTRARMELYVEGCRISKFKNSLFPNASELYSKIPEDIKKIVDIKMFVCKIVEFVKNLRASMNVIW